MEEFAKLREDVQKRGLAAKAAGQRKASREEMCKHITAYSAAELKWDEYTEANVTGCGIPAEVVQQLKQVHSNTENIKEKICAGVPSPWFDVPSLRLNDSGPPSRRLPSAPLRIAVP
jgi:crotonobetainyl-CoA:carnitine CoA-transferase CaiB-like acyl-CoA transferase